MKKLTAWILAGIIFWGTAALFAAEPEKKETVLQQIGAVEKRGAVNLVTLPGEVVNVFQEERQKHPKAWPVTYIPKVFTNIAIRFTSSIHDFFIMPVFAPISHDPDPLTRQFDLPDYVWQKE